MSVDQKLVILKIQAIFLHIDNLEDGSEENIQLRRLGGFFFFLNF